MLPYVIEFNSYLADRNHAADSQAAMKYSQLGVLIGGRLLFRAAGDPPSDYHGGADAGGV